MCHHSTHLIISLAPQISVNFFKFHYVPKIGSYPINPLLLSYNFLQKHGIKYQLFCYHYSVILANTWSKLGDMYGQK